MRVVLWLTVGLAAGLQPVALAWHGSSLGDGQQPVTLARYVTCFNRAAAPCAVIGDTQALEGLPLLLHNGQAAFCAATMATIALHPLDTLKSRLQSDNYRVSQNQPARLVRRRCSSPHECSLEDDDEDLLAAAASPVALSGGAVALQRTGNRQRLFTGLYSGLGANVLKEAPDAAVYLAVCEQLSHTLTSGEVLTRVPWFSSHLTLTLLLCGSIGDAVGTVIRLPAEVACKRLQTGASSGSMVEVLSDVSGQSWLATWTAILLRDVPLGGLQVACYQECHEWTRAVVVALSSMESVTPDWLSDVLAGGLAGAVAAVVTTPLDVLVTQTATRASDGRPPPSALQVGAELVQEQGIQTLTRGMGLRALYFAPFVGAFFGLYEYLRALPLMPLDALITLLTSYSVGQDV